VGNFLRTGNNSDLIDRSNLGTQTSVNTENLTIDDGSKDKEIEHVTAGLPD
jgi:hypothetical protein